MFRPYGGRVAMKPAPLQCSITDKAGDSVVKRSRSARQDRIANNAIRRYRGHLRSVCQVETTRPDKPVP